MKRFKLKASSFGIEASVNPNYQRKYSHICFYFFFRAHLSECVKLIEVNSPHLKTLEFNHETLDSGRFMKALNIMSKLESFKFRNTHLLWNDDNVTILPIPALKRLDFSGHCKYLKYFTKAKLTSLSVSDVSASDVTIFNNFIETQQLLECLTIMLTSQQRYRFFENIPFFIDGSYPCLKKLSIKSKHLFCINSVTEKQVLSFFKSLSTTLEELEFHCIAPKSVYIMIFEKMPALKKVGISVASAPAEKSFYCNLAASAGIKDLLIISHEFQQNLEHILNCFSHIECLRIVLLAGPHCLGEHQIDMNMAFRTDLRVPLFNLKSLYYEQCDAVWHLKVLPNIYPFLETLSLSELFFPQATENIVQQLKEFKALKHVRIRGGLKSMAKFYFLFNEAKLARIESVEIVVSSYHETFEKTFRLKMTADRVLDKCEYLSSTVF